MERITTVRNDVETSNYGADDALGYDATRQYNRIHIYFIINNMKCGTLHEAERSRTSADEKIIMNINGKEIIL